MSKKELDLEIGTQGERFFIKLANRTSRYVKIIKYLYEKGGAKKWIPFSKSEISKLLNIRTDSAKDIIKELLIKKIERIIMLKDRRLDEYRPKEYKLNKIFLDDKFSKDFFNLYEKRFTKNK